MKVRFLKYCPWSYRLTNGTLKKHGEDSTAIVPDIEGREMVRSGYAKEVNSGRPATQPAELKVVKAEETKPAAKTKPTKKARKKAGSK